ncbi:agmatinase family protein [Rikenella microfusus]|uniref:agmatinase family protein n=1 Tax=Rikenella microfusus TaxID=28139 RepID=UPI001DCA96A5|nr:agmatinase family protein [Rikenella microfusus]HJE89180.1 agmatinase family protein [Rikenella microfusus]
MSGNSNTALFSPDDVGVANGNYFGLPFSPAEAELVLLSAPWDVTVSYNPGTAAGPQAIIDASTQVELRDAHYPEGWRRGIATAETDPWIAPASERLRKRAEEVIAHLETGGSTTDAAMAAALAEVNAGSEKLNEIIFTQAASLLTAGRTVGLVGGDHSTPLGLMRAVADSLAKRGEAFGILHIDAHADLREAYEGFACSHASIMYNALRLPRLSKLVQVGIRDFCGAEAALAADSGGRVVQFDDYTLARNAFEGLDWSTQCSAIIEQLPENVYVSFDIDGLSPDNCPGTGTPVPGGLSYREAVYLLAKLADSGRRILGFDLVEVAPSNDDREWNANVGARMLYKLCNLTLKTRI